MITGYDHVQVAIPTGGERAAREFYGGLLGMIETPKPPALAARGGAWFRSGSAVLHLGVDEPFTPAAKAHPCLVVEDLDALRTQLVTAGYPCTDASGERPGISRLHTHDPFDNRLEFQQA